MVVRIMAPFWVLKIIRRLIFRGTQKGAISLTTTQMGVGMLWARVFCVLISGFKGYKRLNAEDRFGGLNREVLVFRAFRKPPPPFPPLLQAFSLYREPDSHEMCSRKPRPGWLFAAAGCL